MPNLKQVSFAQNDNFKLISSYSFQNDKNLSLISLPNSLLEIDDVAFEGCSNLYFDSLPSSLKIISDSAFTKCESLKDFAFDSEHNDTFEYVKTVDDSGKTTGGYLTTKNDKNNHKFFVVGCLMWGKVNVSSDLSIDFPDNYALNSGSVTSLTFLNTVNGKTWRGGISGKNLTYLALPNGLTEIGDGFLFHMPNLKTLIIPNTIKTIGQIAFITSEFLHTLNIPTQILNIKTQGIALDPNGGIAYFQNTDLSYIQNLDISKYGFDHWNESTKYRYVTPVIDTFDNTIKLLNKYKEKLGDNIEENDMILPHWDNIGLVENKISDLNDDSLNKNQVWSLKDKVYWTTSHFADKIQCNEPEYDLSLVDGQNIPIKLPDWLNFNSKTAEITLKDGVDGHKALNLNNIHIKVQDTIFGYTLTSTKSFNVSFSAVASSHNIWAPLMSGVFGGIVFSGLTTGTILVIKNKKSKDNNK